ncbi:MAG TPA: SGNH/GDSL hydrolase family protein [Gemmataceae bacterium]|nr:SGNH/GDSL hydrolase family protein [Gemmataceae bacterium]
MLALERLATNGAFGVAADLPRMTAADAYGPLGSPRRLDSFVARIQFATGDNLPETAMRISIAIVLMSAAQTFGQPPSVAPLAESWDYVPAMKKAAVRFAGNEGVVLHVGGSMTIANPYTTWARSGKGKSPRDVAILRWMHTGANDKSDGWWLCRTEIEHYRAYTAESGLESPMLRAGGKRGLPPLEKMLAEFKPRMVTIECGIYDVENKRPLDEYEANMAKAIDQITAAGAIPILTTIIPFKADLARSKSYSEALRKLAKSRQIPVLDVEREILTRRPDDWYGKLTDRIHLIAAQAGTSPGAEPTAANLASSGYLLRCYLTVQKIAEIKERVLDAR